MDRLLREYVTLLLEKIRSTKKDSPFGDKFDLKKFKALENVHQLNAYAESFLQKLGQGSSRAAYVLSNRYVLKIAINNKGIAQNETEVGVYTNPKTRAVIAKVHAFDPDYKWVIADAVRELKSDEDFTQSTGLNWYTFLHQVESIGKGRHLDSEPSDLAKAMGETMKQNNLLMGDIKEVGHWGKTPDGRVVMLDYGFTGEVWEKHYSQMKPRNTAPGDASTAKPGQTKKDDAKTAKTANEKPKQPSKTVPDEDEKTVKPGRKAG